MLMSVRAHRVAVRLPALTWLMGTDVTVHQAMRESTVKMILMTVKVTCVGTMQLVWMDSQAISVYVALDLKVTCVRWTLMSVPSPHVWTMLFAKTLLAAIIASVLSTTVAPTVNWRWTGEKSLRRCVKYHWGPLRNADVGRCSWDI